MASGSAPSLPAKATHDDAFAAEPIDRTWASTTQIALTDKLKTVPNVRSTECHTTECVVVLVADKQGVGKSVELLTSDRELHKLARNILLTAPTLRSDGQYELHAFAQFDRADAQAADNPN